MRRDRAPLVLPMQRADAQRVQEIAAACFGEAWERPSFEQDLDRTFAFVRTVRAEARGPICAFIDWWRVQDEVHVLSLATHPEARRAGYARLLLADCVGFARAQRCKWITLEVRKSNAPAIALYSRTGFSVIGERPEYYADDGEDALVMMRAV